MTRDEMYTAYAAGIGKPSLSDAEKEAAWVAYWVHDAVLSPCPFCGGEASMDMWKVHCTACPAEMESDPPSATVKAWNRRS